ncbi:DUF1963 domain-containing protein [Qipengyuania flava]|uniref:DUF1963 domain-containing protein n=1 Tax=Qipengyuania flava TaxID=192812 RepID=UPI001C62D19D|nr:DUF1963 domain-containing protein [Qipengyuania flava]QYJ07085.1 DUF1963 domain-containing protein [Qipengyuania flava]
MGFLEFFYLAAAAVFAFFGLRRARTRRAHASSAAARSHTQSPLEGIWRKATRNQEESDWLRPEPAKRQERAEKARRRKERREEFEAWKAKRAAPPIEEDTTVVMRKQVPPKDLPPRSWVGGLPMLPDDVEWPRVTNPEKPGDGDIPLHFICQIALADLPTNLWAGKGPREGWLLLFSENNSSEGVYRMIHTPELGSQRQPPADIGVIHDGMFCDGTAWKQRESVYPRVPVDLISMPNRLYERDGAPSASPEKLDHLLYEGHEIGENGPYRGFSVPFSWRCVALAVDMALAAIDDVGSREKSEKHRQQMCEKLLMPGAVSAIVPRMEDRLEKAYGVNDNRRIAEADPATLDESQLSRRAHLDGLKEEIEATGALLARFPDAESLLAFLDKDTAEMWRDRLRPGLVALRKLADQRGLDTALSQEEWEAIKAELATADRQIWSLAWGRAGASLPVTVRQKKLTAISLLERHLVTACANVAKLCYFDTERRHLVPEAGLADFEAHLRSLDQNRPQRLGGFHDGVQSETGPHPDRKMLLLQMACDYVFEMLWGDCGAIYAWIDPDDLDAGRFDRAEIHLECH